MRPAMSIAVASGFALAAYGSADAPFGRRRDVAVEKPGWVRIALDGPTLADASGQAHVRVLDAAGKPVPWRFLDPAKGRIPAKVLSVKKLPESTDQLIIFDLGPTPIRHHACHVLPLRELETRECTLFGSRDGERLTQLASGSIFRLGRDGNLQAPKLTYPPTECRYLCLQWPAGGDPPSFESVAVETTDEPPAAPAAVCDFKVTEAPPVRGCPTFRIEYPPRTFISTQFDVAANDRFAYVLEEPAGSAWTRRTDASVALAGNVTTFSVAAARLVPSGVMRMRLFGGGAKLVAARATHAPRWILFEAPAAGTYTLQTSPPWLPAPDSTHDLALQDAKEPLMDLVFGQGVPLPAPALSRDVGSPYTPARRPTTAAAYKVIAEGAAPGDVVRIEVPTLVLSTQRERGGALGLTAGSDLLPFLRVPEPLPVLLLEAREQAPQPDLDVRGTSRLHLPVPEGIALVDCIEIALPPRAEPRPVTVTLQRSTRPGVERATHVLGQASWDAAAPRDDELVPREGVVRVTIPADKWEGIEFTFKDDDRPPLASVSVSFWRPRHTFLCVWPATPTVELVLAAEGRATRGGELFAAHRHTLLALPARQGRVDIETAVAAEASAEKTRRTWLTAALAVVAGVLLLVLARALRNKPEERRKAQ